MAIDEATAVAAPRPAATRTWTQPAQATAVVVTGSYGAGHDAAAAVIQARIHQAGCTAEIVDIADLFPLRLGQLLRAAYFRQLQFAPGTWGALFRALDADGPQRSTPSSLACAASGRWPAKRLAEAIGPQVGLVVSTHPFASQALGVLRDRGLLDAITVTYLTDPSVHPLWIHPSVDVHLALHDDAARQARRLGARQVRVIAPPTATPAAAHGGEGAALRAELGLAMDATIALVTSGAEGAGDVEATARDIRDTGVAVPVVLCGRNERLRQRLELEPGVRALGWVDGLTDVIRGSDCVIQNAGGFTALEALALGTPLLSYRPLPGHGTANAQAMERDGLAPWPRSVADLPGAIERVIKQPPPALTHQWTERDSLLDALPLATLQAGTSPVSALG